MHCISCLNFFPGKCLKACVTVMEAFMHTLSTQNTLLLYCTIQCYIISHQLYSISSSIQYLSCLSSLLQHGTQIYSTIQHDLHLYSTIQHGLHLYSTIQHCIAWPTSIQHCVELYSSREYYTVYIYLAKLIAIQRSFFPDVVLNS